MKRQKAFTLVELVVTIAVVIILTSISVPIYKDYISKTKMAEGYALLANIRDAELAYFGEHGNFSIGLDTVGETQWSDNDPVIGVNARTNKYFTWFCINVGTREKLKYSFRVYALKPPELRTVSNKLGLSLIYNLTSGATFTEEYY